MPTHLPRINVTVTEEQHALLLELASLDPDTRSAAGFLRQLLDQVTPLLRASVAMMRTAAQETDTARGELRDMIAELHHAMQQRDLLDPPSPAGTERTAAKRGAPRAAGRGRRQP